MGEKNVLILSSLLKGELSAVETYTKTLHQVAGSEIQLELTELRLAHARRARQLRRRLRQLGGKSDVEKEAFEFPRVEKSVTSEQLMLSLLCEGEHRGYLAYENALKALDEKSAALLREEVLPEQEVTYSVVFTLRDGLQRKEKIA